MAERTRQTILAVALAALLGGLAGCNEVNSMLDAGAGKDENPKTADAPTGAQSAREKLDAYYNREPRKVEQDPNDPIVPCRLPAGTQYMRKNDCVLRGGQAG